MFFTASIASYKEILKYVFCQLYGVYPKAMPPCISEIEFYYSVVFTKDYIWKHLLSTGHTK